MLQKLNDQQGSALLLIVLLLSSIFLIAISAVNLVFPNINMGKTSGYSVSAFAAAETGAENALYKIRYSPKFNPSNCPASGQCMNFTTNNCSDCSASGAIRILSGNGARYWVQFASSSPNITLTATGDYNGTHRSVELKFAY